MPLIAHSDRHEWTTDPDSVYLNHGSFALAPNCVRSALTNRTVDLQNQPMRYFLRRMEDELDQTAEVLGAFVGAQPANLALVDNATFAMNIVARSVRLSEGDEVVLTNHEYGAVRNIWQEACRQVGAKIVTADLPLQPRTADTTESLSRCLTERTRLLVFSDITSASACPLPVGEICRMARERDIPVCIDGPHAVCQRELRLEQLACDYYCGSGHKWLCGALGSGFLWVHPKHRKKIRCPMISWGGSVSGRNPSWQDRIHWLGTRNPAAVLSLREACGFFTPERRKEYRSHARALLDHAAGELQTAFGIQPLQPDDDFSYVSMRAFELPQPAGWTPGYHGHPDPLQVFLQKEHGIEVPVTSVLNKRCLRLSAHLYNTSDDLVALFRALDAGLQREHSH